MRRFVRRAARATVAVCALGALTASVAQAGGITYTVTRFDDPPPEACTPADCSLREAVVAANADSIADKIEVSPGDYTLTIPGAGAGGALEGDLDITQNLRIENANPGAATINGNGVVTGDRVLRIVDGETKLLNVGVTGGIAPAEADSAGGGGIYVNIGATLSMVGGRVAYNSAPTTPAGGGGGIYKNGTLDLQSVVVENNLANDDGFGGGVYTGNSTSVSDSVIRQNEASFGGGVSGGGYTSLYRSRVRENRALDGGGAYYTGAYPLSFSASNLNGNIAEGKGGAIRAENATVYLRSSPVTDNTAGAEAGGISAKDDFGGDPTQVTLGNTILANNIDLDNTTHAFPDCWGETGGLLVSDGYNIIGNNNGCGMSPGTGDQIGFSFSPVDPKLQSPAFNGGSLIGHLTQALLPGSPARNAGDPDPFRCKPFDSRGVPRKLGGRCDIGAYEKVSCEGVLVNRVGTSAADSSATLELTPTDGADGFLGLSSLDSLKGGDGDDGLCGGKAADTLKGGKDDDVLAGEGGGDHLVGGSGHDKCIGGGGTDTASGCEVKKSIP